MKAAKRIIATLCASVICLSLTGCASSKYKTAKEKIASGDYEDAIELLTELGDYKDSLSLIEEVEREQSYLLAVDCMKNSNYEDAINLFKEIGEYKDSIELSEKAQNEVNYLAAIGFMEAGSFSEAYNAFLKLGNFSDANKKLDEVEKLAKAAIVENYKDVCFYLKDAKVNETAAIVAVLQTDDFSSMYAGFAAVIVDSKYIETDIEKIISISADLPFASDVKYQCEKILPLYSELANYSLSSSSASITACLNLIETCDDTAMNVIANGLTPTIIDWNDSAHDSTSIIADYNDGLIPYFDSILAALE